MARDRRWRWLAGALVVVLGALAWGIPLGTLLAIAALLACPAAMFFGMGMMGRTQEGGMACHPGTPGRAREEAHQVSRGGPSGSEATTAPQRQTGSAALVTDTDGDPILILKRRLAAGQITLEEYERLALVIGEAPAAAQSADAAEGHVTHAAD